MNNTLSNMMHYEIKHFQNDSTPREKVNQCFFFSENTTVHENHGKSVFRALIYGKF